MTHQRDPWRWLCPALLCVLLVDSCDLLRLTPLTVAAWTPGDGFHGAADARVSITFSSEPDRASAEDSFSLACDGDSVSGRFEWDGTTMILVPNSPLISNAEYQIAVGADARTPRGFSMERAFEARFTTRPESSRPWVVYTSPANSGCLDVPDACVEVHFSEALDAATYRDSLSLVPSITGDWSLDEAGSTATFRPRESWRHGAAYRLDIAPEITDTCGNSMGQGYVTGFLAGSDSDPPVLISVAAVNREGLEVMAFELDEPDDSMMTVNHNVETAWLLRLHFSEPVKLRTLASLLVCEGGPALILETTAEASDQAVFHFEQRPPYGSHIVVRMRAGVEDVGGNATIQEQLLRITMDGSGSEPPRFIGIRVPLAPGAEAIEDRQLAQFSLDRPFETLAMTGEPEGYPIGVPTMVTLELYVDLATGAALDRLAIMRAFGITATNGALEFQPLLVEQGGFESVPACAAWSSCAVARVSGKLTNRANSGVVTISLAAGFGDSLGNTAAMPQCLPLLK